MQCDNVLHCCIVYRDNWFWLIVVFCLFGLFALLKKAAASSLWTTKLMLGMKFCSRFDWLVASSNFVNERRRAAVQLRRWRQHCLSCTGTARQRAKNNSAAGRMDATLAQWTASAQWLGIPSTACSSQHSGSSGKCKPALLPLNSGNWGGWLEKK